MTDVWAVITGLGLLLLGIASLGALALLYAQVRVARRIAAGPLLENLHRELQGITGSSNVQAGLGTSGEASSSRTLQLVEFFERIDVLVEVGALEARVAGAAFGDALRAVMEDDRIREAVLAKDPVRSERLVALHARLGAPGRIG